MSNNKQIPAHIKARLDAVRNARLAAAMDPSRGRHALDAILKEDFNNGTREDANVANALLTVSYEILENAVAPWDFTWDAEKGLRPETSKAAAARLLEAVAQTGQVAKVIQAQRELGPLVTAEQVTAAAETAVAIRTAMTAMPPAAPAEVSETDASRATG